ncbi:flagellar hook-basal body complex protein [Lawsonibacter sp. LCP25S3_G6]|uniref:flagellar hook-basal body complex protein n=1 Tax=unclassified Lawsonibacter TaxID=2617946 RepID=UPI003F9878A8
MSMSGAMSAAISGLKTHMQALNVVGNNIANVNTYGYKTQRFTFKDSIYSTLSAGSEGTLTTGSTNPRQTGYGCTVGTIDLDMSSGDLVATGRDLDCTIGGDGFFLVGPKDIDVNSADAVKKLTLTRVGDFEFRDGYLTDGQGNVVYGFVNSTGTDTPGMLDPNNEGKISTDLVPIRLPMRDKGNGLAPDDPGYVAAGGTTYPGIADTGKNVDPEDADDANVDGYINYTNMKIDENGKITCTNSDTKEVVVVGYIALGTVENPNGVLHTDGPYYSAGDAAGSITVSTPNSAVTGSLRNGNIFLEDGTTVDPASQLLGGSTVGIMTSFLEGSSTDLATEFTNMILYQRGYQANTRIVTVTDTMLEELVNMKR